MIRILDSPERKRLETQFAADHAKDTNHQLCDYVKKEKLANKNFKAVNMIGYCYIVERFGSWQKVMTLVNRDLAIDSALKQKEGGGK